MSHTLPSLTVVAKLAVVNSMASMGNRSGLLLYDDAGGRELLVEEAEVVVVVVLLSLEDPTVLDFPEENDTDADWAETT